MIEWWTKCTMHLWRNICFLLLHYSKHNVYMIYKNKHLFLPHGSELPVLGDLCWSLRICELWRGLTSAVGVPHMCHTGIRQKINGSLRFVPLITMAVTYQRKPYHNNPLQDSALMRCTHIPLAKAIPTIKPVVKRQESTFHSPWGQSKGVGLNTIRGQLRTKTNNFACHKIQWSFKRYEVCLYMLSQKDVKGM